MRSRGKDTLCWRKRTDRLLIVNTLVIIFDLESPRGHVGESGVSAFILPECIPHPKFLRYRLNIRGPNGTGRVWTIEVIRRRPIPGRLRVVECARPTADDGDPTSSTCIPAPFASPRLLSVGNPSVMHSPLSNLLCVVIYLLANQLRFAFFENDELERNFRFFQSIEERPP